MKFILVIIQICILIAGYSIYLNQWIQPSIFPYFNLISLGFPVIFIFNFILLLFWWVYRWKYAVFFTLLSLGLLSPLNKIVHFYGEAETTESNLKLLTYNVQYFFNDSDGVMNLLNKENADIVLIQEMGAEPDWIIKNANQEKPYYFQNYNSLGIASKFPIVETQRFRITPYPTTYCYADIALPQDTIRFITFYLESLHINQEEIKDPNVDTEKLSFQVKTLSKKVVTTAKIHQKQIEAIKQNIKNSPHPVVLAGDLNAVPSSYEYHALKGRKKDSFIYGSKDVGTTFPSFGVPLRLDYIFVPQEIKIKSNRIEKVGFSDHYPVIVELFIP